LSNPHGCVADKNKKNHDTSRAHSQSSPCPNLRRRQSGATNVLGRLVRVIPQIHHTPPVALVQFPDGIEPVNPEDIIETPLLQDDEQLTLL